MTWKNRIIRYLEAHDFSIDHSAPQSTRYVKYRNVGCTKWYHLGKSGAVLTSKDGVLMHAVSITEPAHRHVALWEKKNGYLH